MPLDFQITVDAGDPHMMADWWAEALGWEVEPQDEKFIRSMIDQGFATETDATRHRGSLVWREAAAITAAIDGITRRVLFQLVPEPKTVKNRMHLDVRVGAENVAAVQARLEAAGASFLHTGRQGPHAWVTMADPEGNEFCIT
jgi:hypothetical protein